MAVSIYKWLGIPLFISFLYVIHPGNKNDLNQSFSEVNRLHPFHVSTVEINHNAHDKTLEVTCRIFTDDFEAILEKNYKTKVDLTHPKDKGAMDKIVNDYILKHLFLKADGKTMSLQYVGFEIDNDAVNAYFEVENIPSIKKVEVSDSILYDQFTDQIGIVHVIVGGNRKSTELNYPDVLAVIQF